MPKVGAEGLVILSVIEAIYIIIRLRYFFSVTAVNNTIVIFLENCF